MHSAAALRGLQDKPASLLGLATSAEDARVMLEALEAGTSGVVLKTQDPLQVHSHVPRSIRKDCQAFSYLLARDNCWKRYTTQEGESASSNNSQHL